MGQELMVAALLCMLLLAAGPAAAAGAMPPPPDVATATIPFGPTDVARLGAWAWRTTGWEVIPFQVDPRNAEGGWDFTRVPLLRTGPHDEVVVAVADLGGPAPEGQLPPGAVEVLKLHGPAGGIAYLARHRRDPPRARRRWLHGEAPAWEVVHDGFTVAFEHDHPFVINRLVWAGDPERRDWIDTGKFRASGRIMGAFRFLRTREDFTSRVTGTIDGPVRVVVRTENRLRMAFGLKSPRSIIDLVHTPRTLALEMRLHIPFRIGWFFDHLTVRSTIDLAPGRPRTITCPNHVTTAIDGRPQPTEVALRGCPLEGFTIEGPYGTLHGTLSFGPRLKLEAAVYFADDETAPDPPEEIPGHLGESGVILTGWERLHRGDYQMRMLLHMEPADR